MGSALSGQESDPRLAKLLKTFLLTKGDINQFQTYFNLLDKSRSGYVKFDDLFESLEYKRNSFTDEIVDLFSIEFEEPEFGLNDFIVFVCNYCFFETSEIIRFLLFMYDTDKQGYIAPDDVKAMMNILHNIVAPDTVRGTVKKSWRELTFTADNKVDFNDLIDINRRFPLIFSPAFNLQMTMMRNFMGESWWTTKKRALVDFKNKADKLLKKKDERKRQKERNKQSRKIIKQMGAFKYYLCPCIRHLYDPDYESQWMSSTKRAEREAALKAKRRQDELEAKNPNTHAWDLYDKKINPEKGGNTDIVVEKYENTERFREERQYNRGDRKRERRHEEKHI